jgi:UDP-N-acetylglucosamine acyltransferase
MTQIHPTAIIDPKAEIGEGVEIGPYSVIGPDVRIGAGTVIKSHVVIEGHTTIGKDNTFFPMASIGQMTQDLKYKGGTTHLEIGDNNTVREFVTINTATDDGCKTVVGNHNHIMAYSHIAHECELGDYIIMSNLATLAGHVIVDDYVVIGGMGGVHQFCKLGRMCMIGACTKVTKDIVPFAIAEGSPAQTVALNSVRMHRQGFCEKTIRTIKEAYKVIFRQQLKAHDAVEKLREEFSDCPEVMYMADFIANSERGILR